MVQLKPVPMESQPYVRRCWCCYCYCCCRCYIHKSKPIEKPYKHWSFGDSNGSFVERFSNWFKACLISCNRFGQRFRPKKQQQHYTHMWALIRLATFASAQSRQWMRVARNCLFLAHFYVQHASGDRLFVLKITCQCSEHIKSLNLAFSFIWNFGCASTEHLVSFIFFSKQLKTGYRFTINALFWAKIQQINQQTSNE